MAAQKREIRRLYKSRTERMIDGVCGGLAGYLNIDSTLVRIALVLLLFYGGLGLVLYLIGMILMPTAPQGYVAKKPARPGPSRRTNTLSWGILLVSVGGLWLLNNMGFVVWHHWWGFSWSVALAVLLILVGVAFLFGGRTYVTSPDKHAGSGSAGRRRRRTPAPASYAGERLFRSRTERKILGVCGGLGAFFTIDPTITRLVFVIAVVASGGFMILPYLIMAVVVPLEPLPAPSP
ncbi:MAG: PspC domain-containing protein [Bacteroidota bacterium]